MFIKRFSWIVCQVCVGGVLFGKIMSGIVLRVFAELSIQCFVGGLNFHQFVYTQYVIM